MKVVVDTNVFVSGILWRGTPSLIIEAWLNEQIQLVVNTQIINEYSRVLSDLGAKHPNVEMSHVLNAFPSRMDWCSDEPLHYQVCKDPDDDKFIACALAR